MNKIEFLIKKYCPEGIEYKDLSEVLDYEQPTKYIVKSTNYNNTFSTPVLTAGQTFILGFTDEIDGKYFANKKKPAIIFDDFTTSFHWVDFEFKVKSSAMKILTAKKNNAVDFRFVFYAMNCINYIPQDHARQWISVYSKFRIPIPPLPIQQEIVNILDKFTQLEAELEAELEAREVQYEYYKNKLLNFDGKDIKMKTLGEVCYISSGGTPSKGKSEFWNNGTIKWLGSSVCQNKKTIGEISGYITEAGLKSSSAKIFNEQTTLIALVGATIGKVAFLPFEATTNQNVAGLYPLDTTQLNTSYLYYSCKALYKAFTDLSQDKFTMANLTFIKGLKIPLPSIAEQQHIVSILDNFELLVNDLSNGLPAEINARKKQYEYYRNKLLTFKELEA
ncbi:MAG: restriction endonuclease subunit S [Clostridiales bacterium]